VAEEEPLTWETELSENYLDDHNLFRGIHKNLWKTWESLLKISPNFFITKNALDGLSTDWSKYTRPQITLEHLNSDLSVYGIIELNVGRFKDLIEENEFPLTIQHDPIRIETETETLNRGHTLINGFNTRNSTKIRRKLSKIAKWVLNLMPILED